MITLRLDTELEQTINTLADQRGVSKSEFVRESIAAYIKKLDKPSAWELGDMVFGKYASGAESLSRDRKALLKERIRAKR